MKPFFRVLFVVTLLLLAQEVRAEGTILRQVWAEVGGVSVNDLTSFEDFPNYPTASTQLTSFEAPENVDDSYGSRVVGYVHAPTTGNYTFWIASDDASELWLSTSDDP